MPPPSLSTLKEPSVESELVSITVCDNETREMRSTMSSSSRSIRFTLLTARFTLRRSFTEYSGLGGFGDGRPLTCCSALGPVSLSDHMSRNVVCRVGVTVLAFGYPLLDAPEELEAASDVDPGGALRAGLGAPDVLGPCLPLVGPS